MQDFTDNELKIARFFVGTRVFWKRLAVFALFFLDITLIYLVSLKILFYMGGNLAYEQMLQSLTYNYLDTASIHRTLEGDDLRVGSVQVVGAELGKIDLFAEVTNPNTRLLAREMMYRFIVDGVPQETVSTFVLPGERKEVLYFGVEGSTFDSVNMEILQTKWRRVDVSGGLSGVLSNLQISDLNWTNRNGDFVLSGVMSNNSGRGFWSVGLPIVVRRGSDIIGTNYITLLKLEANEVRDFEVNWPYEISRATNVTVSKEANVYDESVFMPVINRVVDPSGLER